MDDLYLVEIRLGRTKWKVGQLSLSIAGSFGIEPFMERHPHVTLYGPMVLMDGVSRHQMLDTIGAIAARYDPVPFTIDHFEKREGLHGGVIAFSVHPSDPLKQMTREIAAALLPITRSQNVWDAEPEQKWFHVTVANRLELKKTSVVFAALPGPDDPGMHSRQPGGFLSRIPNIIRACMVSREADMVRPLLLDETGLRITVMHGDEILAEYDLLEKRWIYDDHQHDNAGWQATMARFRNYAGFELTETPRIDPGDIRLIADLHLGHANIIHYCSRPFLVTDPGEMDRVLINNWNAVVAPGTRVYHLGDLRYGKTAPPAATYRAQLRGDIVFIAGNHDEPGHGDPSSKLIEYTGMRFLLVHDPAAAPAGFDGWVVHGHHHNNDLRHYPFIDFEHRRINVSAEVAGYVPVSLRDIRDIIRYRMTTGNIKPLLLSYPYIE
ncbi:MAG: 2'-5' RNA ligase family protein [Methanoregula sp.]|nr:2'-5' RNA ligase family protein [Methanoregula sp.]